MFVRPHSAIAALLPACGSRQPGRWRAATVIVVMRMIVMMMVVVRMTMIMSVKAERFAKAAVFVSVTPLFLARHQLIEA